MEEFLNEFVVEVWDNLSHLDRELITLEKCPQDREPLKTIFRVIHSIKGSCGMFGFQRLERLAHAAEDLLGLLRDGALPISTETIQPVLSAIDVIKSIMGAIEKDQTEPAGDDTALVERLRAVCRKSTGEISPVPVSSTGAELSRAESANNRATISEQSLRVHVGVLDRLMNLVGELVLSRNQLVELSRNQEESPFSPPIQQLSRIVSGLQEAVMMTRMQPIGQIWGKLPRIVRDLSHEIGKPLELKTNGAETEIDRQILQAIHDPIVHCVRNAADHGIEMAEVRQKNCKPSTGEIFLNAFHEGGQIVIEIRDDGAGIDLGAVSAKAVERGLISAEERAGLTESKILSFIFEPGFSTARQVTEVSGRGVGMDVVRTNVEKIGGSVELATRAGHGTTVRIKIPLTLAIISALIVNVGRHPFALPQVGVLELVRITAQNRTLIEDIHGSRVLKLRDRLLPVVDLAALLGIHDNLSEFTIVVAKVDQMVFGLIVQDVLDTQEIVVKPVGKLLRAIQIYAGSTILGDGRVVLILDLARIAARAFAPDTRAAVLEETGANGAEGANQKTKLLLFRTGKDLATHAIPLAAVSRIEEFPVSKLERNGGRLFVQYRGGLLRLLRLGADVGDLDPGNTSVPAIIFADADKSVGLLASEIVDIVEERLVLQEGGFAVLAGHATRVLEISEILGIAGEAG
ncbi:MAG: chemotaxis protein CheA [Bdellovibrionota bacterium]